MGDVPVEVPVTCRAATCHYQEPHIHGLACDLACWCKGQGVGVRNA